MMVGDMTTGGARNLRLGMPDIKKIEANTQYNGQLSYHGHNKSIIINSASLLHAGGGALARRLRSAAPELPLLRWGGREGGGSRTVTPVWGTGGGPRAGGALEKTQSRGTGARGEPQAERQREQFFCMLGFFC